MSGRPMGVVIRGLALVATLTLSIGCTGARLVPNTTAQHSTPTESETPTTSPSPRPTKVVSTTVMTYRELNKHNPGLTGDANVRPGLLVKVIRTVFSPPVAGDCAGGYGPAGVNEQGRIRMIVNVSNDKTGTAMDSEISCVHHRRSLIDASALCHAAELSGSLTSWSHATVNKVRHLLVGIGNRPSSREAHAFHGAPGGQAAAWCWTAHATTYKAYAVTGGYPAFFIGSLAGPRQTPSGSPADNFR
jgi:hypothetical protein